MQVISVIVNLQVIKLEHSVDNSDTTGGAKPGLLP